jgi:hypothetical protein
VIAFHSRHRWCARLAATVLVSLSTMTGLAAEPRAEQQPAGRGDNIRVEVVEGGVVRIFYDLVGADPQQVVAVRVVASQDEGRTFDLTPVTITGDVGPAIAPGPGKRITWEAARDIERLDADRLRIRIVIAGLAVVQEPRRMWGISAALVPVWSIPARYGPYLFDGEVADFTAAELRIGLVRGASQRSEWGISLIKKRLTPGATLRRHFDSLDTPTYVVTRDSGWLTGAEVHTYRPFVRLGSRGQLGATFAAGMAGYLNGTIERRTADERGLVVEQVEASELYDASDWNVLRVRAELGAGFALNRQLELRVSGGFNFPGLHVFSLEVAHYFGAPRR